MQQVDRPRTFALLVVALGIIYFYFNIFAPRLIPNALRIGIPREPMTLLVIGTDINFDSVTLKPIPGMEGRADSILLIRIFPSRNQINVLSIPRDTLVNLPGYGWSKINAANIYGGMSLLKQTVFSLTHQKIDHYLAIRPQAVIKLVDTLGGVQLEVEKDLRYVDRAQKLDINLKAGRRKLSGKQAHDFIRFRHDNQGDIGRIARQQQFLKAVVKALIRPSNFLKAPFAIGAALRQIETDLPITDSIRLLNLARMISPSEIRTITVAGDNADYQGVGSVWLPNQEELRKALDELF